MYRKVLKKKKNQPTNQTDRQYNKRRAETV